LHNSEAQNKAFMAAFNSLAAKVLTYDSQGKIVALSDAMAEWLGYEQADELVGKELSLLLGEEQQARLLTEQELVEDLEWTGRDGNKLSAQAIRQTVSHEGLFGGGMICLV
jgi:PAS domain S-box-containing protein